MAQSEPQDLHDSSRWKATIEKFERMDEASSPPEEAILFVGSSSIRLWELESSFPDLVSINRGFGGSHLADSVQFIDRLVLKHKPLAVVMYAGDNDIYDKKTPERVFADFAEFVAILHKHLPKTTLHYVAIKPSIKRWSLVEKNRRANHLISSYCDQHDKLFFVDIDKPMLQSDGKLNPSLFAKDGLHLSQAGYDVWNKALRASLEKPGGFPNGIVDHQRPRVIVLTDISNEPDDEQSMVRLLCYANQFDIEGLIATTSVWLQDQVVPREIIERIKAYGQVRPNLVKHADGWPTEKQLMSVVKSSMPRFGMKGVGQGQMSNGSKHIIEVVDRPDPRPVYVSIWGGANCLAQALWHVKETRTEQETESFVAKLRVYAISDQDDSGPWIRTNFPRLSYIISPGREEDGGKGYHFATWVGISGDKVHGRFSGADFSIVDNPWLDQNIRKQHGPLGALYPQTEYLMEGDTPSFLGLVQNGLNSPDQPNFGGWGGRYERYVPPKQPWHYQQVLNPIWTDAFDTVKGTDGVPRRTNQATIWRWREAFQNDFAARMDWSVTDDFSKANHAPSISIDDDQSNRVMHRTVRSGKAFLAPTATHDPDGDEVELTWFHYPEAGTYQEPIKVASPSSTVSLLAPRVDSPKTIHLIVQAKDNGSPNLYSYRRIVLTVQPTANAKRKRPRVFITTGISTEKATPDDRQSLCHLLYYADQLDIRGIVPDRFDENGDEASKTAVDQYESDYNSPWTRFRQLGYPHPDQIRSLILTDREAAMKRFISEVTSDDERPIYVLAWGDLEFAADAIEKATEDSIDLMKKIRLLSVGTNKLAKQDNGTGSLPNWNHPGRQRIFESFKQLWWIENDWTYNGMYAGTEPVEMNQYLVANGGHLGKHIGEVIADVDGADLFRASDTPTVLYLLDPNHNLHEPTQQSWAGKFHRPFPNTRPNYWTGIKGDLPWNYLNPTKTWDRADQIFDLRVNTFLKTRPKVYSALKQKIESLYLPEFQYEQKLSLEKSPVAK